MAERQLIRVRDIRNAKAIVTAFQQALDRVLNPSALALLQRNKGAIGESTDYVYPPRSGLPALGEAAIVLDPDGPSVMVSIYTPGHHRGQAAWYAPAGLAQRLVLTLPGTGLAEPFKLDSGNNSYKAHLYTTPLILVQHPRAVITRK